MGYNLILQGSDVQLARQRSVWTLVAMIVGITIFERVGGLPVVLFSVACGGVGVSMFCRGRLGWALLFGSVVLIAGGWLGLRTRQVSIHRLDQIVASHHPGDFTHDRIPIELIGVVIDPVRVRAVPHEPGDPPTWATALTRTRIRVEQVYLSQNDGRGTWAPAQGYLRVVLPEGYLERADGMVDRGEILEPGQRVGLIGKYRSPGGARNLGEPDWGSLSAQSGRVGTLIVPDRALIERVPYSDLFARVRGTMVWLRGTIRQRAMGSIGLDGSGDRCGGLVSSRRAMLGALLLGARDPAFGDVYESFKRVGVAHVLAISGFHLGLVILIGSFAFRVMGSYPRSELLVVVLVLGLGMVLIPLRAPIVRAGLIVMVLVLSGRFGRRYDRLTVLAWVGVGLLIWRPMDVFSLGYQLSMGVSALLVMLVDPARAKGHWEGAGGGDGNRADRVDTDPIQIDRALAPRGVSGRFRRWVIGALGMNFSCWAVAWPTIAYHAGIVSVLAPVVAVILIPLVVVVMVIGYGQIAVGMLNPEIGGHTIGLLDWFGGGVLGFVGWVDGLPGSSVRVGGLGGMGGTGGMSDMWGVLWVIVSTGVIGALVTRRVRLRDRRVWAVSLVLIGGLWVGPVVLRDRAVVRLDMLDVGDGTGVLVQSGGEVLMWDCGSLDRRIGSGVARTCRSLGIRRIGDVIVTHDNLDHFNGLLDLAAEIELERVWISGRMIDEPSSAWTEIAQRLALIGVDILEIQMGTTIELGEATLTCLWPENGAADGMNANETSVVMRVDVGVDGLPGSIRVLLTGDLESRGIEAVLKRNPGLEADVMEAPHHGSAKARAMDFVSIMNPEVVLQSTGGRRLDDPRWDAVRRDRDWYTTAERGGVWVRILRDGTIEHGWAVESFWGDAR